MTFDRRVYEYLKSVPEGKVVTYGMVARAIGSPRASRQVGRALHRNPQPVVIPCHRVVNREGRLAPAFAFGGAEAQARLLRAEGVTVTDGFVDLKKYVLKSASDAPLPDTKNKED
ncbi:MAG: MGMT family protein [Candidatus Gallimonas sp.]